MELGPQSRRQHADAVELVREGLFAILGKVLLQPARGKMRSLKQVAEGIGCPYKIAVHLGIRSGHRLRGLTCVNLATCTQADNPVASGRLRLVERFVRAQLTLLNGFR